MTSHRHARRLAEHLIRRACRRLPDAVRDERYREWAAELPAILTDPDTRPQARRTARALLYAADHARGTRRLPRHATTSPKSPAVDTLFVIIREAIESAAETRRFIFRLFKVFLIQVGLMVPGVVASCTMSHVPGWMWWPAGFGVIYSPHLVKAFVLRGRRGGRAL